MSDRTRILLLEPNRYRALLISRGLQAELESVVLARFESGRVALEELAANNYDVAIMNLVSVGKHPVSAMAELLSKHTNIRIIILTAPETPRRVKSRLNDLEPTRLTLVESSEDVIPEAIMDAVRSAIRSDLVGELITAEALEAELVD